MLGQRSAISGTRLAGALGRPILGILLRMDHRDGGLQILKCQLELVRITLFRAAPKGSLLEGR